MGSTSTAKRKWPPYQFEVGFHMESYCTDHQKREYSHDSYVDRFGERFSLRLSETVAVRVMYREHKLHTTLRSIVRGTEQNILASIPEEGWKVFKMPYRWMTKGGWHEGFTSVVDGWEASYLADKDAFDEEARGQPRVPHRRKEFKRTSRGYRFMGMKGGPKIYSAFTNPGNATAHPTPVRFKWREYHKEKWRDHYARERGEWKS